MIWFVVAHRGRFHFNLAHFMPGSPHLTLINLIMECPPPLFFPPLPGVFELDLLAHLPLKITLGKTLNSNTYRWAVRPVVIVSTFLQRGFRDLFLIIVVGSPSWSSQDTVWLPKWNPVPGQPTQIGNFPQTVYSPLLGMSFFLLSCSFLLPYSF